MRLNAWGWLLLLCTSAGCSDSAIIGGLCPSVCGAGGCERACDAGVCSGAACAVDAGHDACAASSCEDDAGPSCSEGAYALTRQRLDLILVIDDSASLAPWVGALHDGLDQFLQQDVGSDIGVGLQRFDEVCDATAYRQLIVPIAPLSQNAPALAQASALMLTASTSTIPALDGVLQQARAWAAAHEDAHVAVVLLTDASPGACDGLAGDYDTEAQRIARAGLEGTPSIKTYVVAFSSLSSPASLAAAGGTQVAQIGVTPADGEVRAALDGVLQDAQPCAFQWQRGRTLAPSSAVVISGADASARRAPIVGDATGCDQAGGFYVADPTADFPLLACPSTCQSLTSKDELTLSSSCAAR